MTLPERVEVAPIGERAANLAPRLVLTRPMLLDAAELLPHVVPAARRAGARFVEQRLRQQRREELVDEDVVLRRAHHAQRRDHVRDDGIVGQRAAQREPAGNAGVEERRLEHVSDLVRAVEQRDVAPVVADARRDRARMSSTSHAHSSSSSSNISTSTGKRGHALRLRFDRLDHGRRVERDEPPRQLEDVARAAVVLLEADARRELEVVQEVSEDRRVRAGPRIDRLLVVADGEHVAVIVRERLHDPVLHRIQVLKLVDEDDVPASAHGSPFVVSLEQLGGLDDERVEVDDLARREESLVALEEHGVVVEQRVAAKAMRREPVQRAACQRR